MPSTRFLIKLAGAAAAVVLSGSAHAAITVFTTPASFAIATTASATDTFASLPIDFIDSPNTRVVSSYGYTASATGGLFGGGTAANPWLSTNLSGVPLTFTGFTGPVSAIGGVFFGSDISGSFLAGQSLTLTATDSLGATSIQTITGATQTSFLGFASTGTLVSLGVSIGNSAAFTAADNLVLAQSLTTAPIPEPESYAMLLAGLAAVGAVARRRRQT